MREGAQMFGALMPCPVRVHRADQEREARHFGYDRLDDAVAWAGHVAEPASERTTR